jgi:hypothetical protein
MVNKIPGVVPIFRFAFIRFSSFLPMALDYDRYEDVQPLDIGVKSSLRFRRGARSGETSG